MGKKITKGAFSIELPDTNAGLSLPVLRKMAVMRAYQVYVQQPGATVRYVWENFRLDPEDNKSPLISEIITFQSMRTTAGHEKWNQKRAQLWGQIERQVTERLQADTTRMRLAEMQGLREVYQVAQNHVFGVPDPNGPAGSFLVTPVRPRSLEGLVSAMVQLDKHIEAKRGLVAEAIREGVASQTDDEAAGGTYELEIADGVSIPDNLDDADIFALAEGIAKQRAARDSARLAGRKRLGRTGDPNVVDAEEE